MNINQFLDLYPRQLNKSKTYYIFLFISLALLLFFSIFAVLATSQQQKSLNFINIYFLGYSIGMITIFLMIVSSIKDAYIHYNEKFNGTLNDVLPIECSVSQEAIRRNKLILLQDFNKHSCLKARTVFKLLKDVETIKQEEKIINRLIQECNCKVKSQFNDIERITKS